MKFKDLYNLVVTEPQVQITFELLRRKIVENHPDIKSVKIWRLTYQTPTRNAHYTLFDERTSAYDGEQLVADIGYCSSLEESPSALFFALCKELMHVFDEHDSWVDTEEKFRTFLRDLQNTPLSPNGEMESERRARWMALIILCPKPIRDKMRIDINENHLLPSEMAQRLGVPDWIIARAIDDYYDTAFNILMQ